MNIIEKINADIITYRRNKNSDALISLQTLLGAINNLPKNKQDDSGAISKIKASLEGIEVMLINLKSDDARVSKLKAERELLFAYMPKILSNEEVDKILDEHKFTSIKDAMAHFKTNYPNRADLGYISKKLK
jgi:uncharacterized protein YqeY